MLRHRCLDHAPHRLAEVRHVAEQGERGAPALVGRLAEVLGEQQLLALLVQLVVDREVPEVEVAVAHARVLPVHDPHALAVVQEVGAQEVVVARHGRVLLVSRDGSRIDPGPLAAPPRARPALRRRGSSPWTRSPPPPGRSRTRCVSSSPESWKARSARATSASVSGSRSSSAVSSRPVDEARDEAGRVLDEGRHRRRDAELRGALVRGALRLAVDAQQRVSLPGSRTHVVGAAEAHAEVAVRDPAVEGRDGALRAGRGGRPRRATTSVSSGWYLLVHGSVVHVPAAHDATTCAHAPGNHGPHVRAARGAGAARPSGSFKRSRGSALAPALLRGRARPGAAWAASRAAPRSRPPHRSARAPSGRCAGAT